jgi:hypothetical protein
MRLQMKMPAGNRKVGGHGKLFASPGPKQGAVVPDSQPHLTPRNRRRPLPDQPDQRQFAFNRLRRSPGGNLWHF